MSKIGNHRVEIQESVIQCLARAVEARRQALAPFTKGQNDG